MQLSLKILIPLTVVISLVSAYDAHLQSLLALSWAGIEQLHLWQLITYLFVGAGPLSFGSLVQLAFNMYILWMFGTALIERSHPGRFFTLYFGSGLFAGLISLLPLYFSPTILTGTTSVVYAIMVAWVMLNPGSQLLLFFALPFKAHWLVVFLIGLTLFFDLSSSNWVLATNLISSCLFSYLFTLIVWREQGPFAALRPFERSILRFLERKREPYHHSKIYDIKSGSPILDDAQFMDAMLDQISRLGEDSLTPQQKKRMHAISARKKS
ncbi:MAG TPA: rhomboid family intramembrane serine protease [Chlamydiales bacterium]|nr:rhomboid family intramembrane serine protease [Chlamydiales bacterium]